MTMTDLIGLSATISMAVTCIRFAFGPEGNERPDDIRYTAVREGEIQ